MANRTWFSRGLRGIIASRIQSDLLRQGFFVPPANTFVDGIFAGDTEASLKNLQADRQLTKTGAVDDATWQELTPDPIPSLFERCLSLTAAFEGHGFGLLEGDFDGAGLTWGIVGYTLSNGEIQKLLAEAESREPGILARVMGDALAAEWADMMQKSRAAQVAWAHAMSFGASMAQVPAEWKQAFARLGKEPTVQDVQLEKAHDDYFVPCLDTAAKVDLTTELGIALCFDMHVQNGKSRRKAVEEMTSKPLPATQLARRKALANAVADYSAAKWREDVRTRKLAIAMGTGKVHERMYTLAAWGLAEEAA